MTAMNVAGMETSQDAAASVNDEGISLAPMGVDDIGAVLAIEREVQAYPWSRGNFMESLAAGHAAWSMRRAGELIGFAVTMHACDESELLNIGIARRHHRQGLGGRFLEHLFAEARRRGTRRMFLEVRASNVAALALYARSGFVRSGLRAGYYPAAEGREDALVLEKTL